MSVNNSTKEHELDLNNIHVNNIDTKNREIFLHSYISDLEDEPGIDYRVATVFQKNIRYLNSISIEPILIHMHLPGGSWTDCLGIYDAIKFSKSKVIILAYGSVESASSVILQSADCRILMPNTNVMLHYGSFTINEEHSKAAASSIQWNERECDKMVDIFTDKCLQSSIAKNKNWKRPMAKKHIIAQLANKCDWILTANEAVEYNFADGVLGSKRYPNIDELKNTIKRK
jgi:ATP-dependent protease ClpP protease subunit